MSNNIENEFTNNNINNNESEEINYNKIQEEIFRFTQDLEFIQLLANPNYLECKF